VRLQKQAFDAIQDALLDALRDIDDCRLLARQLGPKLEEITPAARLPVVALALIEYAEANDQVGELIACAQAQNPANRLLRGLNAVDLEPAPSTDEVVDRSSGGSFFKDQLKEALGELGEPGMHLAAAGALSGLLAAASDDEAETLYLAMLGNLKTTRPDEVVAALGPVFASAMRRRVGDGERPDAIVLDLTRARLARVDLSGLDLRLADIAFADLRHAKLEGSNLWRTKGYAVDVSRAGVSRSNLGEARWHSCVARETRFHECRMVSAVLKESDLTSAEFQRALLQGAHFERADLRGARFEHANLADAFFTEAKIDEAAAATISRAIGWEKAHFDEPARELIAAAAAQ
jgi:uncharacterized protein YjbI with pentapeptide repeats